MRLNFGREGFIFFSFYRFQKIYPDNTIIEFPVILNQHKRKQKKRFPVKLIRFGKPRDFLDYHKKPAIGRFLLFKSVFFIEFFYTSISTCKSLFSCIEWMAI